MTPTWLLMINGEYIAANAIYTVFLIVSIKLWLRQGQTACRADILSNSVEDTRLQ